MSTLYVLFMTIGICYAINCYELQQSQISSLNDRMAQMLNSFYTPFMPNAPVTLPTTAADYGSPYDGNPYQYASPIAQYGSPSFYTPSAPTPAIKQPYYNTDPREYPAFNWGRYYENYPTYSDFERSQFNPVMSYSPPYVPPTNSYAPTPYIPPCSVSPPLPSYPAFEYPFTPEYPPFSYPTLRHPPPQFTQYRVPSPPPVSYPSPLYHRYAEAPPPAPYFY